MLGVFFLVAFKSLFLGVLVLKLLNNGRAFEPSGAVGFTALRSLNGRKNGG